MKPQHRRQVLANFLDQHGPLTLRELGRKTGRNITDIERDLHAMEDQGSVKRTENEGWRNSTVGRFTYSLLARRRDPWREA